jgi:hypothetical protein
MLSSRGRFLMMSLLTRVTFVQMDLVLISRSMRVVERTSCVTASVCCLGAATGPEDCCPSCFGWGVMCGNGTGGGGGDIWKEVEDGHMVNSVSVNCLVPLLLATSCSYNRQAHPSIHKPIFFTESTPVLYHGKLHLEQRL